ncbi:SAM-dependent methyltransferase, partial [Serratia fonticola]
EYQQLLQEQGFQVVSMVAEDPDCGGRTVWLAQLGE